MPFLELLSAKFLAVSGFVGSLLSTIFLSPPRYVWGCCGLVITAASIGLYLRSRFV
jgi:hypothetical protein